ncbi:hypothetical protein [Burkholderia ubonensis]|nr:hypothetical protein [Burkholderia ubonensis]
MSDTKQPIPNVSIFAERGAEMDVIALMRRGPAPAKAGHVVTLKL